MFPDIGAARVREKSDNELMTTGMTRLLPCSRHLNSQLIALVAAHDEVGSEIGNEAETLAGAAGDADNGRHHVCKYAGIPYLRRMRLDRRSFKTSGARDIGPLRSIAPIIASLSTHARLLSFSSISSRGKIATYSLSISFA
jgi:hypothetical protein